MALSIISGPQTKVAPCLRAKRRVATIILSGYTAVSNLESLHLQAPDLTIGARKTPFLKSSLVRWSSFARLYAREEGEDETRRRNMARNR